ncbi:MAG: hypothetical protein RSD89_00625, partial [Mucinivorans sp.]
MNIIFIFLGYQSFLNYRKPSYKFPICEFYAKRVKVLTNKKVRFTSNKKPFQNGRVDFYYGSLGS